jgi:catalase (peroxidase I)
MAQSLQDLLSTIIQSDPVAAAQLAQNINPAKVVDEIQYLRGAGNIKRFRYSLEEQQQMQQEQERRMQVEEEKAKTKPSISLAGKLTVEQEAAAAQFALGTPQLPGASQDGVEKLALERAKPPKPASNGATK